MEDNIDFYDDSILDNDKEEVEMSPVLKIPSDVEEDIHCNPRLAMANTDVGYGSYLARFTDIEDYNHAFLTAF
ncbi:hypothetical protein Ancab_004301, partial [Ancistrocladus abbreviatus]